MTLLQRVRKSALKTPSARRGSFLLALVLLLPLALLSQVESGNVVGTVYDTSGAVIPGATVTVKNVGTAVEHQATTNSNGQFTVTQLQPGTYTVAAQHEGFKRVQQAPFALDVNQVIDVQIRLEVGAATQTVEVASVEPLIEAQTSSLGAVVEEKAISDLPLNGRDFIQLTYLTPGVNQGPSGNVQSGGIPEDERGERLGASQRPDGHEQQFPAGWIRQQRAADRIRGHSAADRCHRRVQDADQWLRS